MTYDQKNFLREFLDSDLSLLGSAIILMLYRYGPRNFTRWAEADRFSSVAVLFRIFEDNYNEDMKLAYQKDLDVTLDSKELLGLSSPYQVIHATNLATE